MVRRREGVPTGRRVVSDSPEFRQLTRVRGRFVRRAVVALVAWFAAFLLIVGAAPSVAGAVVLAGMGVGFLFGLSQFVFAWLITWRYLRLSKRVSSQLEASVVAAAGAPANDLPKNRRCAVGPGWRAEEVPVR
jgi:uncharacterized membrane protein (DUF485 family)